MGLQRSANTQINRWNLHDIPAVLEEVAARGIHAWQIQFTVAMARAADHPSMLLQPYQLLEVMPMIARLKARADELGVRIWSGNNVGYYGPYEKLLYEGTATGHHLSCGAGSSGLGARQSRLPARLRARAAQRRRQPPRPPRPTTVRAPNTACPFLHPPMIDRA